MAYDTKVLLAAEFSTKDKYRMSVFTLGRGKQAEKSVLKDTKALFLNALLSS